MRRGARLLAPGALALALIAAGAVAQGERRGRGGMSRSANPSAVVAAELAFNQLAQSAGQWTAFRKTADKDAVMFVPQAVNARTWLKGRADPAAAVRWTPQHVFMACDGSYGVSTGPWVRPDGAVGYFTTLWRRDRKGGFKWVLDHGDALAVPRPDVEAIEAKVADCARRGTGNEEARPPKIEPARIPVPPPASGSGQSDDGSLHWRWAVQPDGARSVRVTMRYEGKDSVVIDDRVKGGG